MYSPFVGASNLFISAWIDLDDVPWWGWIVVCALVAVLAYLARLFRES